MAKGCLAFIPARWGSKRIPKKNITLFNGKPLIYYSIKAAQNAQCFQEILVSTDSQEIGDIAKRMGCIVINRPPDLSTDVSSTAEAAQHALLSLESQGLTFESIATIQPTNPLRVANLIVNCLKLYSQQGDIDSLITVSPNNRKVGTIENQYFKTKNYTPGQRSQDLKEEFFENGLLYISKANMLLKNADLFGTKIKAYIVDHWSGYIDIDEMYEFEIAEFLHKKIQDGI